MLEMTQLWTHNSKLKKHDKDSHERKCCCGTQEGLERSEKQEEQVNEEQVQGIVLSVFAVA